VIECAISPEGCSTIEADIITDSADRRWMT